MSEAVLETGRLVLRRFTGRDTAFVLRLLNEPSFIENIGDRGVRTLEQAERYLVEGPIASYQRHGHGLWMVALKETQHPIGMCGLLKRDQLIDVDLGYAFLPEFWSRGYARESASAVLEWARVRGMERIVAIVSPGNAPSIRLLEKLGFAFERLTTLSPGAPEVALYALRV
ncbi:MAG TPA: GNAT family N-acetyltransferase [Myxococcales bacterium]|nr:GNAT family N-acetyltransferase [Myxococcales bacterium]